MEFIFLKIPSYTQLSSGFPHKLRYINTNRKIYSTYVDVKMCSLGFYFSQEYRLDDQRCDPNVITKTKDEQFFSMIFYHQSKRMDDQRSELPVKFRINQ